MTFEQSNSLFSQVYAAYLVSQSASNVVGAYLKLHRITRDYFLRRIGDPAISAITPDQVRAFLIWLQGKDEGATVEAPQGVRGGPLAGSTVDIHFRNLKAFLNWCEAEELILRSPIRKVKRPRYEENLPDALTEAEVLRLLDGVRGNGDRNAFRDYVLHLFFLDTGVRLQELATLSLGDLNIETGYAKVMGKGRKERIVPLGLELRRELNRYLLKYRKAVDGETALFVNEHGFRLEARGIQSLVIRDLKVYVGRALNRCGPHTERHTFATFQLRYTRDLKTTSIIMGHSTTRTTERYSHMAGTDVLRNAEGSPMDNVIRHGKDMSHTPRQLDRVF